MSEYTLQDWIETKQVAYELSPEQLDEIADLLEPAIAKCHELNIPFSFLFQGALLEGGLSQSSNGTVGVSTVDRIGANFVFNNLMFINRDRMNPDEALAHISYAVQEKLKSGETDLDVITK